MVRVQLPAQLHLPTQLRLRLQVCARRQETFRPAVHVCRLEAKHRSGVLLQARPLGGSLSLTVQWKYSNAWCSMLATVAMAATQSRVEGNPRVEEGNPDPAGCQRVSMCVPAWQAAMRHTTWL